ncbi:hypothetical protein ONS95_012159 [Cadophora gregata]|uniref:uncharacterized protein n=1 Tax=Cadophora gregata TaxID=51156 RepID=UPI0026DB53C5|nr:uncharacterized protein ONS95_012159 [Cadophora gregata]KAK0117837.1 hypothetical protein ONS95_012159 [Cadophora gregata]
MASPGWSQDLRSEQQEERFIMAVLTSTPEDVSQRDLPSQRYPRKILNASLPPVHLDPISSEFVASKHLAFQPPSKIISLADIHLPDSEISPVASSVPFPLLSAEAIKQHRKELFSKDVLDNCTFATRPGSVQLRGMAPRYAPFVHQFWNSSEVLGIISNIAGVDLVPVMDYEICHTNVQLGPGGMDAVRNTPIWPPAATEEEKKSFTKNSTREEEVSKPIVPWHRDSHPFVCVVMLSNTDFMTDGETELMKGDGSTIKVRSPECGHAVVLQGRSVSHIAIPAGNMPERITIVTSFRPRDPVLQDSSSNMNVRNKSLLPELNYQWTTYRLELLSERFRALASDMTKDYQSKIKDTDCEGKAGACKVETVNVEKLSRWMESQISYMEKTLYEMRPVTVDDWVSKNEV